MYNPFRTPVPLTRLYFAYGNNLWLEHMASRCPESVYVGRAVLPDHRWYIDRKGVANIAPHSGSTVHGLVFEITANDEVRLDRSERTNHGPYTKEYKRVNLYEVPELQTFTQQLVRDGGPKQVVKRFRYSIPTIEKHGQADVLVYFSRSFVRNGQAYDHFVGQMNHGIRDAISLGVPQAYFKNVVRKWIPRRETLYNSIEGLNQRALVNYQVPILSGRHPIRTTVDRRFTRELGHEWDYQTPHLIIEVRNC
ncbi:hypothetical protein F4680DRAFT_439533 [Xylaria scruposa]|nr:hypothetical protein F4680DRAFT_439533 [Xylaria scruposa]